MTNRDDTPCYAEKVQKILFPNAKVTTKMCKVCDCQDDQSKTVEAQNETGYHELGDGRNTTSISMDDQVPLGCAVSPCQTQATTLHEPIVFGNTRPTSPTTGSQYTHDGQQQSSALSGILPTADNL